MKQHRTIISELAEIYPQLYLDPEREEQESYRAVVLRGQSPEIKTLTHFKGEPRDRTETVDTPAGPVSVITLFDRGDFETFVRCMMAAKEGSGKQVPATMGAATLMTFNWPRINARKKEFFAEEAAKGNPYPDWNEEFARFRQDKRNYIDMIIVLSAGPYSNISAEEMGLSPEEWLEKSMIIRKYHECMHFICRTLYPDRIDAVFDELAADAVGLYAAFGYFEPEKELIFLGIRDGKYTGGRLENYVEIRKADDPEGFERKMAVLAADCTEILSGFEKTIHNGSRRAPFDLITELMK